ncbi:MAG: hydrogenase maturation nickel metallochaperone HypA [bacterium]|nr:hydrogenase maturation nickel metallochaperone HypA [bacterium]
MHELSIINDVLDSCLSAAALEGAGQINRIRLKIGERSGVSLDALGFAFEVARIGTLAEGAQLDLVALKAEALCLECGQVFRPEMGLFLECPHCQGVGQLRQGQELLIDSLEIQ